MRTSLALKIFLSYWLIHAVIFVVLALVHGPGRPGGPPPGIPYRFLVTAIIVSGVICLLLAQNLTAPLRRMRAATHRLAAGDLSARAGTRFRARRDEIGEVVGDFDAMAERIEALLKAQQQLLSDISHELRSPLARLNVALELARRSAGPGAEAHLARIESEADRMNEMIGRLLALSRAESVGTAGHVEEIDLAEIVRRVASDAQYEASRMQKRVVVSASGPSALRADAELVASAIENVIRNAIRYTPADSTVDVSVAVAGQEAQVVVRDHGAGIPEDEKARVFLPFHRVDGSRDRESGGTGLGLSIAQRAITSQGGTIRADNAEGGGLRVTMTLPLASR